MKIAEVFDIREALKEVSAVAVPGEVAYALAKNMRTVGKVIAEAQKDAEALATRFLVKGEDGRFKTNEDGSLLFESEEKKATYNEAVRLLEDEEREVVFHTVAFDKVKSKELTSRAIAVLLDKVFTESAEV